CLATFSAIGGIVGRICARRGTPEPDLDSVVEAFRGFAAQARAGDPIAREIFDLSGRVLGTAVANLLNDRDPGPVIIMSFEPDMRDLIAEAFHAALRANTLPACLEGLGDEVPHVGFKAHDDDRPRIAVV